MGGLSPSEYVGVATWLSLNHWHKLSMEFGLLFSSQTAVTESCSLLAPNVCSSAHFYLLSCITSPEQFLSIFTKGIHKAQDYLVLYVYLYLADIFKCQLNFGERNVAISAGLNMLEHFEAASFFLVQKCTYACVLYMSRKIFNWNLLTLQRFHSTKNLCASF